MVGVGVRHSWYVDETYIKVSGRWCYLYRAVDRTGALVDVMLSETRDMAAAEKLFRSAKAVTGVTPARVTTDGHDSYPRRAIRSQLGVDVRHRNSQYLNNRIEQDHRGIKSRYGPMRASARWTRQSLLPMLMMNSGTSCTPITISAKPHYPPLVVAASFKEAALPSS